MSILSILTTVVGTLMSIGHFFQTHKIFKRKSAKDISIIMYSILFVGTILWALYGFEIHNPTIIVPNLVGVVAISCVLIGWIKYR